ncbi:unnamed protein product [Adineta steineri]|uniref:Cysteine-rich transmembrane CYSTM domain-containing protein n=1 Tax=Adineta steineri TaxID=433720 RepID=A0A819IWS1_9BILA|nr:unnamed protein product [Adineta steineri]CAF3920016.1 unnamed protein product [Adineta steineri]
MNNTIQQQPSSLNLFNGEQDQMKIEAVKNDTSKVEQQLPSRNNFPKGLRGGGACFDCLACLCFCCAIEEIACFECCKDC